ncbi:hypothetical protein [Parashewanella tropica]|uniref:hypothetical protein n=1 Tax=Parashewanella tropica TaxID=2547970 RepID=UPI0010598D6A|nr:hypothetical protein [Parashewanella tropica]
MADFEKTVERLEGIAVPFSQVDSKGYYRGPSGLSRVAEILADEDSPSDGYCFGACVYVLECNFSPDAFIESCKEIKGRSLIRGYHRFQNVLPGGDPVLKYKYIPTLVKSVKYVMEFQQNFDDVMSGMSFLLTQENVTAMLGFKGARKHMMCCRIGGGDKGLAGSIMFDPNYGFGVMKDARACCRLINFIATQFYKENKFSGLRVCTYSVED